MKDKDKPSENCSEKDDVILEHYLTASRINVNVRQVLAPGKEFPDEGLEEEWRLWMICPIQRAGFEMKPFY